MTDRASEFYVAVAAEADQDHLVADIVHQGNHVASATFVDGTWMLTFYLQKGGELQMPLTGLLDALEDVAARLGAR